MKLLITESNELILFLTRLALEAYIGQTVVFKHRTLNFLSSVQLSYVQRKVQVNGTIASFEGTQVHDFELVLTINCINGIWKAEERENYDAAPKPDAPGCFQIKVSSPSPEEPVTESAEYVAFRIIPDTDSLYPQVAYVYFEKDDRGVRCKRVNFEQGYGGVWSRPNSN